MLRLFVYCARIRFYKGWSYFNLLSVANDPGCEVLALLIECGPCEPVSYPSLYRDTNACITAFDLCSSCDVFRCKGRVSSRKLADRLSLTPLLSTQK